jgi:hypothetical protein
VIARQLGSHTTGYITWKGGSGSSMESSLVKESDNSRLQLGLQVGMEIGSSAQMSSRMFACVDDTMFWLLL